jgi:hypothetical protein
LYSQVRGIAALQTKAPPSANSTEAHSSIRDLELNVGELRCRIDLPMCAQALLSFVLEVLALWPASFGSRF